MVMVDGDGWTMIGAEAQGCDWHRNSLMWSGALNLEKDFWVRAVAHHAT